MGPQIADTLNAHPLFAKHRLFAVAGTTRSGDPGLFLNRVSKDGRKRTHLLRVNLETGEVADAENFVCVSWPLVERALRREERLDLAALDSLLACLLGEHCKKYVPPSNATLDE